MKAKIFLSGLFMLVSFGTLFATGPRPENGTEILVGAGAFYEPVYSGSDKYMLMPYPFFDISYTHDSWQLFAGLKEGVGVRYMHLPSGVYAKTGIDMGQARDTDDESTEDLLEGTPALENYVLGFASLGWDFFYGELALRADYYRVKADYEDRDDKIYNAYTVTPSVESGYPVLDNFIVLATLGLSFMNSEYAEAYHGVEYETERLDSFKADAGLESVHLEVMLLYIINEHFIVRYENTQKLLLGDAEASPLTKSPYSMASNLSLMYRF